MLARSRRDARPDASPHPQESPATDDSALSVNGAMPPVGTVFGAQAMSRLS
jgi:hypothetical protein